jgi:hypothetical protein
MAIQLRIIALRSYLAGADGTFVQPRAAKPQAAES